MQLETPGFYQLEVNEMSGVSGSLPRFPALMLDRLVIAPGQACARVLEEGYSLSPGWNID